MTKPKKCQFSQKELKKLYEPIELEDREFCQAYKDDNPTDDFLRYEQMLLEDVIFNLDYEE